MAGTRGPGHGRQAGASVPSWPQEEALAAAGGYVSRDCGGRGGLWCGRVLPTTPGPGSATAGLILARLGPTTRPARADNPGTGEEAAGWGLARRGPTTRPARADNPGTSEEAAGWGLARRGPTTRPARADNPVAGEWAAELRWALHGLTAWLARADDAVVGEQRGRGMRRGAGQAPRNWARGGPAESLAGDATLQQAHYTVPHFHGRWSPIRWRRWWPGVRPAAGVQPRW